MAWTKVLSGIVRLARSGIDFVSVLIHPFCGFVSNKRISILCYHRVCDLPRTHDVMSYLNVPPVDFERQMSFLSRKGYNVITLDDFLTCRDKGVKPPEKSVIITFDDGYGDNYLNALPVLEKYNFKGTFFIATDFIGSNQIFPWLELDEKSSARSPENLPYWRPLGQEEQTEMSRGGACLGSHTKSHCALSDVDQVTAREELYGSKASLENILGRAVRCFCYPYGSVNGQVKKLVKEAGYEAAVGSRWGNNTVGSDWMELRRKSIEGTDSIGRFIRKVDGAYDWWFGYVLPLAMKVAFPRQRSQ